MNIIALKLREVLLSVLPVTVLVLLLHLTLVPLETVVLLRFLVGALLIVLGLSIFLFGVDIGIDPIGKVTGSTLAKKNKVWLVAIAGIALGFIISIAEPDLHILAGQVELVTSYAIAKFALVSVVSCGIAVMLSLGLLRIIYNIALDKVLIFMYGIIFLLSLFVSPEMLAIAFDASGATTGAMTVPFILALATGIAALKKDSLAAEEDSFGLVAIASVGAILAVMVMAVVASPGQLSGNLPVAAADYDSLFAPFLYKAPLVLLEVAVALLPILIIFLLFQKLAFRLSRKAVRKILFGLAFSFVGLVVFLLGVNAGFMQAGAQIGYRMALQGQGFFIVSAGFVLGLVTVLAEPAVHVLTAQVESVTSGYVRRSVILASLSLGVGIAIALSLLRIMLPAVRLWHFLLPGYLIALVLTQFVPNLFVGIAFDSGGVASGPMTATFVLAFAQGVAQATPNADVLIDGFGVIAMVALTPLIALQLLGLVYQRKSGKRGLDENEE